MKKVLFGFLLSVIVMPVFAISSRQELDAAANSFADSESSILEEFCVEGLGSITCNGKIGAGYTCTLGLKGGKNRLDLLKAVEAYCGINQTSEQTAPATKTVSGYVYDENNTPIESASVFPTGQGVKAYTTNSTSTDTKGYFKIDNFPDNAYLKVSLTGYEDKIDTSPTENMKITLKESVEMLDETELIVCRNKNEKYDEKSDECRPIRCESERYKLIGTTWPDTKCEDQVGKECDTGIAHAKKSQYKWEGNKLTCPLKKCVKGYIPNDENTACIKSEGECSPEQITAIPNATKGELNKGICYATECSSGYEAEKGKCIEISGNCSPMPANAKVAYRVYDETQGKEICVIDSCKDGYHPSDDKQTCVEDEKPKLSEEDSKKKIEELQANADAMKEKEQSTANKLLGAAGIGATGIGGMMTASALAEQNADDAAERDMQAYLETFRCTYGSGQAKGGDKGVFLPGGNALLPLYAEYQQLASSLKMRKEALGMMPGIESEVVMDKSTMGLYDDESNGITNGTFTSLSRAFLNPSGEDAAEWAAQQAKTSENLKTGLITAGAGVAVGIIGDIAINHNAPKERSAEINAAYELLKKMETEIQNLTPVYGTRTCKDGSSGTYPDCKCATNQEYDFKNDVCIACTGGKTSDGTKCDCPKDTALLTNGQCGTTNSINIVPTCAQYQNTHLNDTKTACECNDTYVLVDSKDYTKGCKCPDGTKEDTGKKICLASDANQTTNTIQLSNDNLFDVDSAEVSKEAKNKIEKYISDVVEELKDTKYKVTVNGYTDSTGTETHNQELSEKRANAIKKILTDKGLKNVTAYGLGETDCKKAKGDNQNDKNWRKVEILFVLETDDSREISETLGKAAGVIAGDLVSGGTK